MHFSMRKSCLLRIVTKVFYNHYYVNELLPYCEFWHLSLPMEFTEAVPQQTNDLQFAGMISCCCDKNLIFHSNIKQSAWRSKIIDKIANSRHHYITIFVTFIIEAFCLWVSFKKYCRVSLLCSFLLWRLCLRSCLVK